MPDRPAPTRTEIAPGIPLFRTAPYGDVGLDDSIAIISNSGVLVFDTNGTLMIQITGDVPRPTTRSACSSWTGTCIASTTS